MAGGALAIGYFATIIITTGPQYVWPTEKSIPVVDSRKAAFVKQSLSHV